MKKVWKILDESIYESYNENNDIQNILNYYGGKLKSDTRNLLGYCLTAIDEYDENNQIVFGGKRTWKFDVKININSKYLSILDIKEQVCLYCHDNKYRKDCPVFYR